MADTCTVCGRDIHMMCRKYTGICSENCEKIQHGEAVAVEPMESEGHHASE